MARRYLEDEAEHDGSSSDGNEGGQRTIEDMLGPDMSVDDDDELSGDDIDHAAILLVENMGTLICMLLITTKVLYSQFAQSGSVLKITRARAR